MMYELFIDSHIVLSSLFFGVAFILVGRMIYKWITRRDYTKTDGRLSILYLVFLYLQFITGVALYFFLKPELSEIAPTMEQVVENAKFRFWVVEHLATMIFALMLSQIGWILIRNSSSSRNKFRNTVFYYGISLIIIVISTAIALIKEGIL